MGASLEIELVDNTSNTGRPAPSTPAAPGKPAQQQQAPPISDKALAPLEKLLNRVTGMQLRVGDLISRPQGGDDGGGTFIMPGRGLLRGGGKVTPPPVVRPPMGGRVPIPAGAGAGAAGAGLGAGAAVGGAVAAVVALGFAAKKLTETLLKASDAVADYSPEISIAQSETEVRRERAMMARAQQLGPGLAKVEAFRGRTEEKMLQMQTKIYDILLKIFEAVEPILDGGVKYGELYVHNSVATLKFLETIVQLASPLNWIANRTPELFKEAWQEIVDWLEGIFKILEGEEEFEGDPFFHQLWQEMGNMGGPAFGQIGPFNAMDLPPGEPGI